MKDNLIQWSKEEMPSSLPLKEFNKADFKKCDGESDRSPTSLKRESSVKSVPGLAKKIKKNSLFK